MPAEVLPASALAIVSGVQLPPQQQDVVFSFLLKSPILLTSKLNKNELERIEQIAYR